LRSISVFDYDDYQTYLRDYIAWRRGLDARVTYAGLAEQARIQRSYLSHVLNGRGNLNEDQLYLLATALRLPKATRNYLQVLLTLQKCEVNDRRNELLAQKARLRSQHNRSAEAIKREAATLDDAHLAQYYAEPLAPLVHMHLCIDRYRRSPGALSEVLSIPDATLQEVLGTLERCGLIAPSKDGYTLVKANIHMPAGSPLAAVHALQFRLKAVERLRRRPIDDNVHFTATFAANEAVRKKWAVRWHGLLEEMAAEVTACTAQDVYHVNFDLFKI
jgi:uncharacterized protein (TIGR02147 family)